MDNIAVSGSVNQVLEFIKFAVNKILHEREVYPEEHFRKKMLFGGSAMVLGNHEILEYLKTFMAQLKIWLLESKVQRVGMIIASIPTNADVEHWQFQINRTESIKEIDLNNEVQNVSRQISNSLSILPPLPKLCSFSLLAYTDVDLVKSEHWDDTEQHFITNSDVQPLKPMAASQHVMNNDNGAQYESMIQSLTNRGKNKRKVKLVEEKILQFAFGESDTEDDEDYKVEEERSDEDGEENDLHDDDEEDDVKVDSETSKDDESDEPTVADLLSALQKQKQESDVSQVVQRPFLVCGICLESDENENDEILECDNCGICVHEGCYGDIDVDDDETVDSDTPTEPWFCEPCKASVTETPICELCPNLGGIYKQTDTGKWVHLVCVLYTPDVGFRDVSKLQTVVLEDVKSSSWSAKECVLCADESFNKTGVCIDCDAGMCKTSFHVTCAQKNGFLSDIPDKGDAHDEYESDLLYAHCKMHSVNVDVKKRKTSWLAFQSHVSRFKRNEEERERIDAALAKARSEFQDFRRSIVPSKTIYKFARLLSSCPEACMMLAKKAETMGLNKHPGCNVYAAITSGRISKVDPNLSSDFVEHFFKRELYITELEHSIRQAGPVGANLMLEQKQLLQLTCDLQRKLEKVAEERVARQTSLASIHDRLCEITGEKLKVPDVLDVSGTFEASKHLLDAIVKKCATCSSTDDQHALAYCTKCSKHYHMNCLDPPLLRMPKKSDNYVWQCTECDSSDESENEADGETKRRKRKVKEPEKFTPEENESDILPKRRVMKMESKKKAKKFNYNKEKKIALRKESSEKHKQPLAKIRKAEEFLSDCFICKKLGDRNFLVKCDECKKCYHFKTCLDPPYSRTPKSKFWGWICEECDDTEDEEKNVYNIK